MSTSIGINRITLDRQGGTGGTSEILAVNGYNDTITRPNHSDSSLVFGGYFTQPNGGGLRYYDNNGRRLVAYTETTNPGTLYVLWVRERFVNNFHTFQSINVQWFRQTHNRDYNSTGMNISALRAAGYRTIGINVNVDSVSSFPTRDYILYARNAAGHWVQLASRVNTNGGRYSLYGSINLSSTDFSGDLVLRVSYVTHPNFLVAFNSWEIGTINMSVTAYR
jgi:hypothetical protein